MAVINGNTILVYVEGQAIGCLTTNTFSSQNEEIVTTCKDDDGARSVVPGGNQASITFEGMFNPASGYSLQDLVAVHLNKERVWVKMGDNENLTITGYAYLNTLEWTAALNAGSTCSGTFTFDGPWTNSIT